MIQLRTDCLVFETTSGSVPCSAEQVTVELLGESSNWIDSEVLRNAAAGVLRYFKEDLKQDSVTVGEFSQALVRVLRGLGLSVVIDEAPQTASDLVADLDLRQLAVESGTGFELAFFQKLRNELRHQLKSSPRLLRLTGLRGCVKQLLAVQRWCPRCHRLNDSIVEFLRRCLWENSSTRAITVVLR